MPSPPQQDLELFRMLTGYMPAFLIGAALQLDIPEAIGESTRTTGELARATSTHEPSLIRMLRALAALGLLAEDEPGAFRLTPRGTLLRAGTPGSMHGMATVLLDESMWGAWPALDHAVRTGERAFDHVFGTDYMSYTGFADGSSMREHIDQAMLDETRLVAPSIVDSYDFGPFSTIVDIGGGSGPLAAAVLAANPHLRGVVFDTADGVALAPRVLTEAGVADRCEVRTGDFFESLPSGDLYLCKSVVFNWAADEQVSAIFANCREVIPDRGRFLLVEQMLPAAVDGSVPAHVYVDDLGSIVNVGGRHRTEPEYRALLAGAGFELTVHPLPTTPSGYSLLEAVPR
ncbi:methyltransferase [Saccharopolyspora indica]|uniref:methyltransferase n=1 Tax=Saccharopolyspora indica TaxID=1229659 RepID=UPI0022EAE78B|nr:methyltransferase [Saccharopolyspora indica]MDA3645326.1 methyltransferase [Saccharopolyspora indica]